jgi:hypothetical protein
MEHVTSRRLRRLEAVAGEELLQQQAELLATELGGVAQQYIPELRRIHRRLEYLAGQLAPAQRHDPDALVRALAAAEGISPQELLAEAKRLARKRAS